MVQSATLEKVRAQVKDRLSDLYNMSERISAVTTQYPEQNTARMREDKEYLLCSMKYYTMLLEVIEGDMLQFKAA